MERVNPLNFNLLQLRGQSELERIQNYYLKKDDHFISSDHSERLSSLKRQLQDSLYFRSSPQYFFSGDWPSQMPIFNRSFLKINGAQICSIKELQKHEYRFIKVTSSGTTGEPVVVLKDDYDCVHMWTLLKFWHSLEGITIPENCRVLFLDTLSSKLEYSYKIPIHFSGELSRINVHFFDSNERIAKFQPHVIFSDPAGLQWLADQRPEISPVIILSSAQFLPEALLSEVEKIFNAPVYDYYSTTETGPIAWRCRHNRQLWHLLESEHFAEIHSNQLVLTRKRYSLFPIVRYDTGDIANLIKSSCSCGYNGQSLRDFKGREQCWFIREDGIKVDAWTLSPILKYRIQNRFQLQQLNFNHFILRLEIEEGLSKEFLNEIFHKHGWNYFELDVQVNELFFHSQEKIMPFVGFSN